MVNVRETLDLPGGATPSKYKVEIELIGSGLSPTSAFHAGTGTTVMGPFKPTLDANGAYGFSPVLDLKPNSELSNPSGTIYRRLVQGPGVRNVWYFAVPVSGATLNVQDLPADPPGTLEAAALTSFKTLYNKPNTLIAPGFGTRWITARNAAGTQRVPIHLYGNSVWAAGLGSSAQKTTSCPGRMQTTLQTAYGNGGSGFLSHEYASFTGTWTGALYGGLGGTSVRATAAATLQWTGMVGTTIRIYYRNITGGSFRYRIDGGSWVVVTPPTGFGLEPGVDQLTGLSDTGHTVDIEWVSGTVYIHGVTAYRATGIVLNRFGQLGRALSHYGPMLAERIPSVTTTNASPTITTATPGSFRKLHDGMYVVGTGIPMDTTVTVTSATSATLSVNATASGTVSLDFQRNRPSLAEAAAITSDPAFGEGRPDLVIIALGGNDAIDTAGFMTAATAVEGASRIVRQYTDSDVHDFTPDFLFIIEHAGNMTDFRDRYASIVNEVAGFAQSVQGAVVDIWGAGKRSWKYWNTIAGGPYWFDAVHPNDAGCLVAAQLVTDVLQATYPV